MVPWALDVVEEAGGREEGARADVDAMISVVELAREVKVLGLKAVVKSGSLTVKAALLYPSLEDDPS